MNSAKTKILLLLSFLLLGSGPTRAHGEEGLFGLFLTWQRDPSSTMTLQWMEESESIPTPAWLVFWDAAEGPEAARRISVQATEILLWPGMYLHRIELDGLTPGTEYRFRVEKRGPEYGFRTMPAALNRPIRFAVGACARPYEADLGLETMLRRVMEHRPDFMVWGGHLAHVKARMRDVVGRERRWDAFFQAIHHTLIDHEGFVTPVVVAIGETEVIERFVFNHPFFKEEDSYRRHLAPYFYQFFAFPGQPGYNTLDFGNYLSLVVLDSDHTNHVDGPQAHWLDGVLAKRKSVPHVFPIYHVAGYPSSTANQLSSTNASRPWMDGYNGYTEARLRRHWMPLFEKHGVQVAFEHYNHAYKRTVPIRDGKPHPEGVVYLGDGALGEAPETVRDPADTWYLERAESVQNAILVTLDGSHKHFQAIRETGEVIDEFKIPNR